MRARTHVSDRSLRSVPAQRAPLPMESLPAGAGSEMSMRRRVTRGIVAAAAFVWRGFVLWGWTQVDPHGFASRQLLDAYEREQRQQAEQQEEERSLR